MNSLAIAATATIVATVQPAALPSGFSYLSQVDASIAQDMRYAGADNFTGAPVPGYRAAQCVLATEAADALARVQASLTPEGLSLVVFDCYRPARAVRRFVDWARSGGAIRSERYNPNVPRNALIAQGYIAARSGHSSGGSVDLGLGRRDAGGKVAPLDMGGGFDLFDPVSHVGAKGVPEEAAANRRKLAAAMRSGGFSGYSREWWHFRYANEPFKGQVFDFEIASPPR